MNASYLVPTDSLIFDLYMWLRKALCSLEVIQATWRRGRRFREPSIYAQLCQRVSFKITHMRAHREPPGPETLGQGPSPKGHPSVMCHTIRKREQTARAHPPPRLQPRQTSPIHHRAPSRRAQSRGMLESPCGLALQKDSFARSRGRLPVLGGGGQHGAPFLEPMAALSAGFMH